MKPAHLRLIPGGSQRCHCTDMQPKARAQCAQKRNHHRAVRQLKVRLRFAELFRKLRQQAQLTQEDLEARAGLSRGAYDAWETGFRLPTQQELAQLIRSLGPEAEFEFLIFYYKIQREAQLARLDLGPSLLD